MPRNAHFLTTLVSGSNPTVVLRSSRTGDIVADCLEPAFDSASRNRGLLGREGLADGTALIIAPCNSVHTFFMRFPIDVIFADRAGNVVKTYSSLGARRIAFAWRGFAAIEMAAGALTQRPVRTGDVLEIVSR